VVDRRGFQPPGNNPKSNYRPSKLSQSTKFDTPSEKGSRSHNNARSSDIRSIESGRSRDRNRRDAGFDVSPILSTPTARVRQRGMIDLADSDVSHLGQNFDTSASMLDEMGDQEFESSPLRARDEMIHTPPSDRTLALGQSKSTKAITKPKIDISDDLMNSVNFDADLDNLDEAFEDVSLHAL